MTLWGSGVPRREFMHVDDGADAILHLLEMGLAANGAIPRCCDPWDGRPSISLEDGIRSTYDDMLEKLQAGQVRGWSHADARR